MVSPSYVVAEWYQFPNKHITEAWIICHHSYLMPNVTWPSCQARCQSTMPNVMDAITNPCDAKSRASQCQRKHLSQRHHAVSNVHANTCQVCQNPIWAIQDCRKRTKQHATLLMSTTVDHLWPAMAVRVRVYLNMQLALKLAVHWSEH